MKVTIEFDNPEDAIGALNVGNYKVALLDIESELRDQCKHGSMTNDAAEAWANMRDMFHQVLDDNDVDLHM